MTETNILNFAYTWKTAFKKYTFLAGNSQVKGFLNVEI